MIKSYVKSLHTVRQKRNDDLGPRPAESDQIQSDRQKEAKSKFAINHAPDRGKSIRVH